MFYERTGCRAIEPYISEIYGDWLYVQANKSKGGRIRKIKLNDDLKSIWMEMQGRKQNYIDNGSKRPNQASYERVAKVLKKIVNAIGITSREITLKSFRHQYAIKRVFITGNVVQVAMEMGHSQITTTQRYLRFQLDELIQYFPSLQPYVENLKNVGKNMQDGNKKMETQELSNINLYHSHRE
tara:strand:- start:37 stop:585 length:549 start_codon:yes stop_codon:yes gene_type:complete